jgi:hypothetical protein
MYFNDAQPQKCEKEVACEEVIIVEPLVYRTVCFPLIGCQQLSSQWMNVVISCFSTSTKKINKFCVTCSVGTYCVTVTAVSKEACCFMSSVILLLFFSIISKHFLIL